MSDLCGVKPYVLRYWEQEFTQLKPMKRRGNRRYYQHHEVLLIRRIRELLYEQGFTISGARNRLADAGRDAATQRRRSRRWPGKARARARSTTASRADAAADDADGAGRTAREPAEVSLAQMRQELISIRELARSAEARADSPYNPRFVGV